MNSEDHAPQFGTAAPGRTYVERPGAYALVVGDGRILVVATPSGLFLPGGGTSPGESAEQTLRREVLEETGCRIATMSELGHARQYVPSGFNKIEAFFAVTLEDVVVAGSEDDHRPRWVSTEDALVGLVEEAQRWAVRRFASITG